MEESIWQTIKTDFWGMVVAYGPKVIYAILVLVFGIFLIKLLLRLLHGILRKSKMEPSLKTFIQSLSVFLLYALLVFTVGITLGIKTSSFLAVFGAGALAIGFALQGSLSNFAGGVLILAFKPFKVDDLVQINNTLGFVREINILYTRIRTYDGRIITMPNGKVANDDVDNRSVEPHRRVEIDLNFSFDEDFGELRKIITNALKTNPDLAKGKPIQVWLNGMGDYAMKVSARCWCKSEDFWDVYWAQIEAVKTALDQNDIHLAIPKRAIYQPAKEEQ